MMTQARFRFLTPGERSGQERRDPRGKVGRMGIHPDVVLFAVNETRSDMAPLADRFTDIGRPED